MKTLRRFLILAILIPVQTVQISAMEKEAIPATTIAWGLSERQGIRSTMEDAYAYGTLNLVPWAPAAHYFGMFDGHGGSKAAEFAAANAIEYFQQAYQEKLPQADAIEKSIGLAFVASHNKLDAEIQKLYASAGTTALSGLILGDELYLAWAGDTRAVVADAQGKIKAATTDHTPNSFAEKQRIVPAGGIITVEPAKHKPISRVGGLAVSRALGDKSTKEKTKPNVIIATPQIIKVIIKKGDIILVACDGLWDVMDNEQAMDLLMDTLKLNSEEIQSRYATSSDTLPSEKIEEAGNNEKLTLVARILRNRAYLKRSSDNISVMIIQVQ